MCVYQLCSNMMSEAHLPPTQSHTDVIAEVLSGESLHVVPEPCPPDYVDKISQCLASPPGQNGRDGLCEGPGDASSDSGDSLFITQMPVPEPVRTRRQRAPDFMSDFRSQEGLEFYEDEISTSASDGESKLGEEKKKKTYRLPKYRFPFLSKTRRQGSTVLPSIQNQKLHNYAMGGFFNCVEEQWESYEKGENLMSPLPTIDMDGECISPISEEEEERVEDWDFKVVGKKQLVVSLKPKRTQPWYNPEKREGRQQTNAPSNAGCGSQRRQQNTIRKVPAWEPLDRITLFSDTESSDDGDVLVQTETPKTQKCEKEKNQEEKEKLGNNNDATVCGPTHADIFPTGNAEQEPGSQNLSKGDADHGILCSETRVKRKKKKKKGKENSESVLEGKGHGQEEAEGHSPAASLSELVAAEEAPSLPQAVDEPDTSESKQKKKKKKRKKNKSAEEDIRQEVEGRCDERMVGNSDVSLNVENDGKKKKKKEKHVNDSVDVESSMAVQSPTDDGEMPKKKKKVLKKTSDFPQTATEHLEEVEECLINTETAQETSESGLVKRKKLKKKKKLSAFNDGTRVGEDARMDADCSSDVIALAGSTDFLMHVSYTPEDDENVGNAQKMSEILEERGGELVTKKQKRKKKTREKSDVNISEETVTQSDYLASARKKGKKRPSSFLVADDEEKAGQTHGEKQTHHGWGAEKTDISTGHLATKSTDVTESLEESKKGFKKEKRRKRSAAEEGVDREKELVQTSQRAVPEVGITEKKRRKRNERVLMSPVEGRESAVEMGRFQTDEVVVFSKNKKKKHKLQAATEDAESENSPLNSRSSLSPKKKGKRERSTETSDDISSSNGQATQKVLFERTSPSSTDGLGDVRHKKKTKKREGADKHLLQLKPFTEMTEAETHDCSFSSAVPETSLSHGSPKNKHKKDKKSLQNPSEDFLEEWRHEVDHWMRFKLADDVPKWSF